MPDEALGFAGHFAYALPDFAARRVFDTGRARTCRKMPVMRSIQLTNRETEGVARVMTPRTTILFCFKGIQGCSAHSVMLTSY